MSRIVLYQNDNIEVITGFDPIVGEFYQIFDKDLCYETPEGEGLIFECSMANGITVNYTGINSSNNIQSIITGYLNDKHHDYTTDFNYIFLTNK